MTAKVRLTPRALEDLRGIGRYTLKTWGKPQRDAYLRALDRRFLWLAEQPARPLPYRPAAAGLSPASTSALAASSTARSTWPLA